MMVPINLKMTATPEGVYVSDSIKADSSSIAIHMEFADANQVEMQQSITGDNFVTFSTLEPATVQETTVTGLIEGQYIRVKASTLPTRIVYLK